MIATYRNHSVPTTCSMSSGAAMTSWRTSTATASTAVRTARTALAPTIKRRRSLRSVMTPAGSVNSSHGSRWTTPTRAISSGLRVIADANHG